MSYHAIRDEDNRPVDYPAFILGRILEEGEKKSDSRLILGTIRGDTLLRARKPL